MTNRDAETEVRYAQRCDASLEDAENIARTFHGTYELLAPSYKTRAESAVEWDDVPEANKNLMCATVLALLNANVISPRVAVIRPTRDQAQQLFDALKAESGDVRDLALLAELNAYLDRVAVSDSQETPTP